jgi:signal transduction histidine kinase
VSSTASSPLPAPGVIAYVDDEPENLNVLEAALAHAGYRVAVFPRGELLLAAAPDDPPDLILLDILMPGLDGYEVCRRLKADARLRSIPVIFISALSAVADLEAGFECGGVDYVSKPFREAEVLARVRTHIALRRAHAELAAAHAHLQELERQRDTYVQMLIHDMRSPLQGILGHLELVEESRAGGALQAADRESLQDAIHGTQILARMVSTAIDLSRMESADLPLRRVPVAAPELFDAALKQACGPANRSRMVACVTTPCPLLFCDVALSVRIVINLLANALKYSPGNSEIAFGADPDPRGVRLWVRDRGPGIAAMYHQRIFEKFGVADQPLGTGSASTGLGLAFCKLAVEGQGGTIGVESEPGHGSTFWFTLPAAAAPASEKV